MIHIIDNYDSFTHNLAQLFWQEGCELEIHRNDKVSVDDIANSKPTAIVISPGPGRPAEAGISLELVRRAAEASIPVLGICLGHQTIGAAFGASVVHAKTLMHGKTSKILHRGRGLFVNLPKPFVVTRYHSLVVDPKTLPETLVVDAQSSDGTVMALRHRDLPIYGLQFHPESFMSEHGAALIKNFLRSVKANL